MDCYIVTNKNNVDKKYGKIEDCEGMLLHLDPFRCAQYNRKDPFEVWYYKESILSRIVTNSEWLIKVTIPEDAETYSCTDEHGVTHFKASKIRIGTREELSYEVIRRLIAEGADFNISSGLILAWAVYKDDIELTRYLMSLIPLNPELNEYIAKALIVQGLRGYFNDDMWGIVLPYQREYMEKMEEQKVNKKAKEKLEELEGE